MKKKGSEFKIGDRVKFTPSGWHYSLTGEVIEKEGLKILKVLGPQKLAGCFWGLWPDHKYTMV